MIVAELQQNGSIGDICIDIVHGHYWEAHNTLVRKHIRKGACLFTDCDPMFLESIARDYTFGKLPLYQYGKQRLFQPTCVVVKHLEEVGLLGTQSLSSSTKQMKSYLDECCFKYNKRGSSTEDMFEEILYSAVRTDPLTYHGIVSQK